MGERVPMSEANIRLIEDSTLDSLRELLTGRGWTIRVRCWAFVQIAKVYAMRAVSRCIEVALSGVRRLRVLTDA